MKRQLIAECALKNMLSIFLLIFFYGHLKSQIAAFNADEIGYQTIIVLSSLLIMAFLFCTFAFTYKDSRLDRFGRRMLDHCITGITIFGCGALLESSYIAVNMQLRGTFGAMGVLMILFYISLVLFDFWDLERNTNL